MSYLRLALALALLLLPATPGGSSTMELTGAVTKTMKGGEEQVDSASRRDTAAAMRAYWKSFSDRLPRLSPAEVAWVEREQNENHEHDYAAINSKEFALWYLARTVESCLKTYDKLLASKKLDRSWEAYFWVKALHCYSDHDLLLHYLKKAGLSNGRADGPFVSAMFSIWKNYISDNILETVLVRE